MSKKNVNALYYMEFGEVSLEEADDINIPINCWMTSPKGIADESCVEGSDKYWHWYADNYQARRNSLAEDCYHIAAEHKKDILAAIRRYVVPLYQICMKSLAQNGVTSWLIDTSDDTSTL